MKRQKACLPARQGFTLVELLIVIALLGALAIGLIGALDPFEQLKKGTDTGTRDLVNQVQTAVLRYFATTNKMPWAITTSFTGETLTGTNMVEGVSNMIVAGEMKSNFKEIYKSTLSKVFVTFIPGSPTNSVEVRVCYTPASKSFQVEPNTRFSSDGTDLSTACKSVTSGGLNCYWCVQ